MSALVNKEQYEKQLDDRWSWITEDIADEDTRLNTQIVLENSYKTMITNRAVPQGWLENTILAEEKEEDTLNEAGGLNTSNQVGDYVIPKVMFPIIRRVMPELIANKLVSVQPLNAPTGVIYYITFRYSNDKSGVHAGDEASFNPYQTNPAYSTYYSSEKMGPFNLTESADAAAIASPAEQVADVAKIFDFLKDDAFKADTYKRIEIFDKTNQRTILAKKVAAGDDGGTNKVKFFTDDAQTLLATVDETAGITISADAAKILDAKADDKIVVFVVYNQEATTHIPEMEFDIDHMDVTTTERKLKVRWTKEAEQDMAAYHKIDVEQELVKVASIQTNYEIDRQIINFIDDLVISQLTGSFDWSDDDNNGTSGNYLDRHRALAQRLYQYTSKVAQYNRLGPADWAVCSPQVAAALQMLPDWKAGEISHNKSTFYNAGSLGNGTMAIYCDPNRLNNDITLGYKGKDSTYGAGVVYSPYANWMSGVLTDPNSFSSIRGTFSRYAITATPRSEFNYSRITLDNFAI